MSKGVLWSFFSIQKISEILWLWWQYCGSITKFCGNVWNMMVISWKHNKSCYVWAKLPYIYYIWQCSSQKDLRLNLQKIVETTVSEGIHLLVEEIPYVYLYFVNDSSLYLISAEWYINKWIIWWTCLCSFMELWFVND